jgi:hypothetical protein
MRCDAGALLDERELYLLGSFCFVLRYFIFDACVRRGMVQ